MTGLIALDMDGTLLDSAGAIPEGFWPLAALAKSRGIAIAPASGRQLATLRELFAGNPETEPSSYIAENGTVVWHEGDIVSTTPIDPELVHRIIDVALGVDATVVVCLPEIAYILDDHDDLINAEVEKYYYSTKRVSDLHAVVGPEVVKVALFTHLSAEDDLAPQLRDVSPDLTVAVSGEHWVDIMNPLANKGIALTALASALGVVPADTVAFGDYLNDLELLQAAGTAYAMANAHPDIKAVADHIAPSNADHGVITELRALLG